MHIGLLEDDMAIQEMIRLVLEDEGHTVTVYSTAEECLHALLSSEQGVQSSQSSCIEFLIVDWRLSGTTPGTEVIRQLRRNDGFKSFPIILTTAATFIDPQELQDLGVALLEKPFAVADIVTLIDKQS